MCTEDGLDESKQPEKLFGVFLDLLISPSFRLPRIASKTSVVRDETAYPLCPRCRITMEREYQFFCRRCGQRLDWSEYRSAGIEYVGWDGPSEEEE